jgi:hypothetical protein
MIIVANYTNPRAKKSCEKNLDLILRSVSQKYQRECIGVLGDFNRDREFVKEFLEKH